MNSTSVLPASAAPPLSRADDLLRAGLLMLALAIGAVPLFQLVGSMIWFREYLGDYQVFWGIRSVPVEHIYDHRVFAYPPSALLLMRPFGILPFWPSLVAWTAAGAIALAFAARRIMKPAAIGLGFATYAGLGALVEGQISLLIGALVIAAVANPDSRWKGPLLAAAAVVKPQSLLAAPVALVAERKWRAIGWAALCGSVLLLISMLIFGTEVWLRWWTELPKFHDYLVSRGIDRMDVGIYGLARTVGLPGWSFLFGVPLGLIVSWLVFRSEAAPLDRYAAFAVSTVLLSPYTLFYDLAGLTFACIAMLLDRERSPLMWLAAALIVSSVFASLGIVLLAVMLGIEALRRSARRF